MRLAWEGACMLPCVEGTCMLPCVEADGDGSGWSACQGDRGATQKEEGCTRVAWLVGSDRDGRACA
eukprot:scaffold81453_cov30-Tisochrysis_lutea.AAC.1